MSKDNELERLRAENEALQSDLKEAVSLAEMQARQLAEKSALIDGQVAKQEEQIVRQLASQRKVRIVIASGRDSHERCPVPVGVNGREFLIERDKEVDVPEAVLNVLDLAKASVGESRDIGGMVDTQFRKASRFAYRVIGYINPQTGELERA